jgi:high-affinity iron transporter
MYLDIGADGSGRTGRWVLFVLPFVTVVREGISYPAVSWSITDYLPAGLEAVVFVGGVSLGQAATSIPIAAIVGIVCGLICGFLIYQFASRTSAFFSLMLSSLR